MDYIKRDRARCAQGCGYTATAPDKYSSPLNILLRQSAVYEKHCSTHLADFGTRVLLLLSINGFDTHANQASDHARLWTTSLGQLKISWTI
ncbi:MAG: hypothetical protein CM1200mP35_09930 [Chloroflexota bacterium]|nr:MAG: hypothetical protein CM1200mP35_09930 [Chloroflexota bacterium]